MNNNFEYYIGDTYTRDFTISGYSAEISDVFFTVKKSDNDKRLGLVKAKTEMRESPIIPEREKNMGMLDKDTKIDAITLVDIGGKK